MSKRSRKESSHEPTQQTRSKKQVVHEPLTPYLERLERLFRSVNTFCAFCDARLTTAMTFSAIKSSVPEVELRDLAAINVIIPDFVQFSSPSEDATHNAAVDPQSMIVIQFGKAISKRAARDKHALSVGNRGDDWHFRGQEVKPVKPEAIRKAIDKRNKQFTEALQRLIRSCHKKNINVDTHINTSLGQHMPGSVSIPTEPPHAVTELPSSDEPVDMAQIIERLQLQSFYRGQIDQDHRRTFPSKIGRYGNLDPPVAPEIAHALQEKGINQLYIHQAEALAGLRNGQHVIVATSTASGKSLIYQIPVLEALLQCKTARAMYLFPTKALAQDQVRVLQQFIQGIPDLHDIMIRTFDGDTPTEQRADIRDNAHVIFSNPDMLHHSILPNASRWRWFLQSLKYVVVDEIHVYNGLFGTNVALIMRRLRRLCHHYGNDQVQFVSCSATIGSPDVHMQRLFGIDNVKLVTEDGSPCGQKEFILWNPPLINPMDPQFGRKNAIAEGAQLLEYLLKNNVRTIAFCKIRKVCEMFMKQLRDNLEGQQRQDLLNRVMAYRGGYTPQDRRRIERRLFNGELLGVVATNALELGIDIGSLDAVLMIGVPWSIAALWQQSGRAGRRNADSLSMVVADQNPLDQYYSRHPEALFEQTPEQRQFEVDNSLALESHLQCAAEELPIDIHKDAEFFGPNIETICAEHLTPINQEKSLYRPHPQFRPYPSQFVNIRNIVDETYAIVDVTGGRNVIIEEIESSRAPFEIYEGRVHLTRVDWTTQQRDFTNVNALSTTMCKPIKTHSPNTVSYGKVQVETVVFGYYKLDKRKRIIDSLDVYMDPLIRESTGIWTDVPRSALMQLEQLDIDPMAAIHGSAHALISLLPKFTFSSVGDIRTECKSPHATRHRPNRIALYETQPSGVVRQAYQHFDNLVVRCVQQIENCACEDGCPSCVHLPTCSEHNVLCSKAGALIIFQALQNNNA
ncbi:P-loop containing nucleoside triphosphate hydrolase protein [Radiomyces spectabilis]|uniref:P-loop containing nucleoside triphosphate hydrolase protein n=1 Tax=Radiomyces spectabilis TaxID=64574 RepID=UPI00221E73D4|nr:P-loop containing nucleoside triphosphate hydrolase protein [Radiomyces spectabilis]KAI8372767.1 P-loop containing nucleoside triphosphate hydrolase protein [Radiomyces spectabilis]